MRSFIKFLVGLLPKSLKERVYASIRESRNRKIIRQWQDEGSKFPPPHPVKQMAIREYGRKYGCRTLIETGTYLGDMVEAQRRNFDRVYSIELSTDLCNKAVERFKEFPNVSILQGDSGMILPKLMKDVQSPALFWLDGHYSAGFTAKGEKDCPIHEELDAIFSSSPHPHILLIDDARLFVGEGDYPTIESLSAFIRSKNPKYRIQVKDDIIRGTIG